MLILGGTGGIGQALRPWLSGPPTYLGSKDLDLRDFPAIEAYCEANYVDEVVNLAGTNVDRFLHRQTSEAIEAVTDLGIMGTLNLLRAVLPGMRTRNYGRIILVSSFLVDSPRMGTGVYAATKAFIEHLVKTCALENARYRITCNAIRLGYFEVGMTQRIPQWDQLTDTIPLGRFCTPMELASTINWLIRTEYVTGTVVTLAGGL